mgnify:CR=1 FL=1
MEYRQMGRTGLRVSELGFGCGAVGGLLVKGDRSEMVRVVGRAIDRGMGAAKQPAPCWRAKRARSVRSLKAHAAPGQPAGARRSDPGARARDEGQLPRDPRCAALCRRPHSSAGITVEPARMDENQRANDSGRRLDG